MTASRIYYSASTNGFYDSALFGNRTHLVDDPDWVRPLIDITLQPGEELFVDGEPFFNDSDQPVELQLPDASAVPPQVEADNPGCRLPLDAVEISAALRDQLLASVSQHLKIGPGPDGYPALVDQAGPNAAEVEARLLEEIDRTADAVRTAIVGDPTRALEYLKAAEEAQAFKNAGYPPGEIPRTVAAFMLGSRSAKDSADSILAEAEAYNGALYFLRERRLAAKEAVRAEIAGSNIEQARWVAQDAISHIQSVSGVGNARG